MQVIYRESSLDKGRGGAGAGGEGGASKDVASPRAQGAQVIPPS